MRAKHMSALIGLALFPSVIACADPATPGQPAALTSAPTQIVITGESGRTVALTTDDLAELPTRKITVSFETEHGRRQAGFEGPLLWTVLDHTKAVDATKPRDQVRQAILITARDGYVTVLALGEIAPEFENKAVILAARMDGQPLGSEHMRVVVPGDRRGGRSVRDVARIDVIRPEPGHP